MIDKFLVNQIKQIMGLNLQALGSSTIKNAIARRMRSLQIKDIKDYYSLAQCQKNELNKLIDEIAINETWFFRDDTPFTFLQKYVKNWLKKDLGTSLRLLSVPCSTGEEPYSMAISMFEAGIKANLFSIDAVDISNRALTLGKKGIFANHSFRGRNQILQRQYFKKTKTGYAISQKIKNSVKFFRGNLLDIRSAIPGMKYDIIFCRNLLIYLDNKHQKQAITNLDNILYSDGLLITGHAEPGVFSKSNFIPVSYSKAFALTKKPADFRQVSHPNAHEESDKFQLIPQDLHPVVFPDLSAIQHMVEENNYEKAISLCNDYLKHHAPSPQVFFLMGKIFLEIDKTRQAIKMIKKAVYLDPNFLDAIKLLTDIYKRQGDKANHQIFKLRSQRVAIRLTAKKSC